jgi:hypothetical protein
MAREEVEEVEEVEEADEGGRPSRSIRRSSFRSGRGGGFGGFSVAGIVAFASRHRVPLMVGGGFLLAYWVGHRRGRVSAPPVTQIYNLPQGGGFRTGIQSSSAMYDARFYDYSSGVDVY